MTSPSPEQAEAFLEKMNGFPLHDGDREAIEATAVRIKCGRWKYNVETAILTTERGWKAFVVFFALSFAAQDLWYALLTCEILLRIFRHGRQTHAPTQTPRLRHSDRRSEVKGSNPPFRLRRLTNCCGESLGLASKAQRRSGPARPASDPR